MKNILALYVTLFDYIFSIIMNPNVPVSYFMNWLVMQNITFLGKYDNEILPIFFCATCTRTWIDVTIHGGPMTHHINTFMMHPWNGKVKWVIKIRCAISINYKSLLNKQIHVLILAMLVFAISFSICLDVTLYDKRCQENMYAT